jgi:hypothetical protein
MFKMVVGSKWCISERMIGQKVFFTRLRAWLLQAIGLQEKYLKGLYDRQ